MKIILNPFFDDVTRIKMGDKKGRPPFHPRSPPLFARLGPKEEPGSEARPRIKSRPSPTTESIVGEIS
jgi:hypothetical protein